jgi:hypothetical protein
VTKGDGLEAWRRVLEDVTQKTTVEVLDLEKAVMHPSPCANPEQVPMALERWQTAVQAYLDAGGEPLNDDRRKGSVTKILPWRVQQRVLWDFDEYKSADELINWIKRKIRLEVSMAPKGRDAHLVEDLDEEGMHELEGLGDEATQDEVNAVYKRFAGRGGPRGAPSRPWPPRPAGERSAARAPPRSAAESSCPNCLEKGHKADECTKPKIGLDQRRCFLCKQTGHSARHCKEKKPLHAIDNGKGPREPLAMCDDDGFVPIQRQTRSTTIDRSQPDSRTYKAMPMEATLADYAVSKNKFAALAEEVRSILLLLRRVRRRSTKL